MNLSLFSFAFVFVISAWGQNGVGPSSNSAVQASLESIQRVEMILQKASKAYESVHDYTAHFLKQERIREKLRKQEVIELKFQKPFKVYMNWVDSPDKGMELIYIDGENDNRIRAHLGGFLNAVVPSVNLKVDDKLVARNNRHIVTETGIGEFLRKYTIDFKVAKEKGDLGVAVEEGHKLFNRAVIRVEAFLPKKPDNGYYCYRSVVFFDDENKLPIQMEFYDHQDRLIEKYAYKNLKINSGLKEKDFDPENEAYHF